VKNVLLLVHDDHGQEARLQAALDLTRALGGHLSCVDVTIHPMLAGDFYNTGVAGAMAYAEERKRESKNKTALEARLAGEDVSWDWTDVTGNFVDAVCDAATLADIIVLNRVLDQFPYPDMGDVVSRVVTHVRAPVLATPETCQPLRLERALIAWDGHASCAATVRACVPLLRLAGAVEIFMVRDGAEKLEPIEAAEYLSRHGIHAEMRVIDDGLNPADQLITAECEDFRADYVVMGAFSHGRLRELFGGVTKRMLDHASVPIVLGH